MGANKKPRLKREERLKGKREDGKECERRRP
jgi:hypothetical protein